jgi:hypothetical protein
MGEAALPYDVVGLTNCTHRTLEIADEPAREASLAHELVHVAQDCEASGNRHPYEDEGHKGWMEAGISTMLWRLSQ